jgi:hypothetical protein
MSNWRRKSLIVAVVVSTTCIGFLAAPDRPADAAGDAPRAAAGSIGDGVQVLGVASCSKRACHGSIPPLEPAAGQNTPPIRRDEFVTWTTKDAHSKAYAALHSDRSRTIVKNLGGKLPAHQDPRCLACHSTPTLAARADKFADLVADGVGCEACHGPARKWLVPHTSPGEWATIGAEARERDYDFAVLDDVARRARACVGCHVGAPPDEQRRVPARDANHEIMAAGHPRLVFEFSAYQSLMPPHWSDRRDKEPTFEARAWAVGQAAAAQTSLELLAYRAGRAERPWPEFAEYDCYSCHHGLQEPSWPRDRGFPGRRPGSLPWSDWNFASLGLVRDHVADDPESRKRLDQLSHLMTQSNPDRNEVERLANDAARDVQNWTNTLAQVEHSSESLSRLLRSLADRDPKTAIANWDAAVQYVLAVAALDRARRNGMPADQASERDKDIEATIEQLRRELTFRKTHESPVHFQPQELLGPLAWLHKLVRDAQVGPTQRGKE